MDEYKIQPSPVRLSHLQSDRLNPAKGLSFYKRIATYTKDVSAGFGGSLTRTSLINIIGTDSITYAGNLSVNTSVASESSFVSPPGVIQVGTYVRVTALGYAFDNDGGNPGITNGLDLGFALSNSTTFAGLANTHIIGVNKGAWAWKLVGTSRLVATDRFVTYLETEIGQDTGTYATGAVIKVNRKYVKDLNAGGSITDTIYFFPYMAWISSTNAAFQLYVDQLFVEIF